MTKNETLNEFQNVISKYVKLLERIYQIKNYSSNEECMRLVKLIMDRKSKNVVEYKTATTYSESNFLEGAYKYWLDNENGYINSWSNTITRLEAVLGTKSNNTQERYY